MIERYTREEMGAIWTEKNKYNAWLEVEILACEACAELGVIPKEDGGTRREKASFEVERIYEIERETRHDVVAFSRTVSVSLRAEKTGGHYGRTSTGGIERDRNR